MMRYGKSLQPLNKKVEHIGTAHGISPQEYRERVSKAKKSN